MLGKTKSDDGLLILGVQEYNSETITSLGIILEQYWNEMNARKGSKMIRMITGFCDF